MTNKTEAVFASRVNGIEFDVNDPVTAKLLRANSKADFICEVDSEGEPLQPRSKGGATGGEIELE